MIKKGSKMLYLGKEKVRREEYLPNLQKGFAKVHGGEKIFPSKAKVDERPVMIDAKLTIMVPATDHRSAEQIRIDYLAKVAS